MKILLLGKNGQAGFELQRALALLGELVAVDRHSVLCGDLENPAGLAQTFHALKPAIVVNAAAYTAVDKAETDRAIAELVNAKAPGLLAELCKASGALLVHYSSDYVFNGNGSQPWCETDAPSPLNYYGQSKLAGEKAILDSGCRSLIFRTSWVFSSHKSNFITTILKLASAQKVLRIVCDQTGVPSSACFLADATAHAIKALQKNPALTGLYHLAPKGETTWFDYAKLIRAESLALDPALPFAEILPVTSAEYQTAATRPLNSRLNCNKFFETFDLYQEPWQNKVRRTLHELLR